MLQRLFGVRPQVAAGDALFEGALAQARSPELYLTGGAPDTPEGRFELYALHVVLLVRRLSGAAAPIAETRQAVFDAFVRNLDDGLRDLGVGDLSVGKKMRRLGEAFYGRLKSCGDALAAPDPAAALTAVLRRTVFAKAADADPGPLAAYLLAADAALAAQPEADLLKGQARWPTPFA